jgi:hypothetical protein
MAEPDTGSRRGRGVTVVSSTSLGLAIAAVILVLIAIVIGRHPTVWYRGLSSDFPFYVWRTKVVSAVGLRALASTDLPGTLIKPDRPGFPVLAALLGSALHMDVVTMVHGVQVATVVAIGLAAGSLAVDVLGEPRWSFPIFTLVVGASAEVARTSIGSLDNLLVDAVVLAIAVAAIGAADGARGRTAAIAGFASAALIHWFFGGLFLLLLGGVTLVLLPWSIFAWRRGTTLLGTPAARMGIVVAGGVAATGISLFGLAPGYPTSLPPTYGNVGNVERLPGFRLPFRGALVAIGAIALWRPDATRRRIGLVLLALWSLSVPVAMIAPHLVGREIKVFRVAGFALGIPILGAAALVGAVRLGRRYGTAGRIVGVLVLAAGLAVNVAVGIGVYRTPSRTRITTEIEQVRAVSAYLDTLSKGRSVIFLESSLANSADRLGIDRVVRAGLPADRIMMTHLYIGGIDDLLARQAGAQIQAPQLAKLAVDWWNLAWPNVDAIMAADPVVLYLTTLNPELGPPKGTQELAPGVLLVRGPPPVSVAPVVQLSTSETTMVAAALAVLVLLGLIGSGWTRWLLPVGGLGWLGLSPAIGIAALTVLGTALGRIGVPLGGVGGAVVMLLITAAGWAPSALRIGTGRRDRKRAAGLSGG